MGMFDKGKNEKIISKVKFLGVRQAQETKTISTVNFPAYSFLIEYKDGGREIKEYNTDSKKDIVELNKLLPYIDM